MLRTLLLAVSLLLAIPSSAQTASGNTPVSLIQLIATPERFDGKKIAVIGFLRLGYEGNLLYLSREDYENVVLSNTLWVEATEDMAKDREKLALKFVRIEGTFRMGNGMRSRFSAGGISDIKDCRFFSDPAHPLAERIKAALSGSETTDKAAPPK